MPIRIQKENNVKALLSKAREFLSDPDHFTKYRLFADQREHPVGPDQASRCCALGAIRKSYLDLNPDIDPSSVNDYDYVPDLVREADVALAGCLYEQNSDALGALIPSEEPHEVVLNVNDKPDLGYEPILAGFDCAIEKATNV